MEKMKRKQEVRWYECNLTQEKSRKFFTETGASLFAWYLEHFQGAKAKIYAI